MIVPRVRFHQLCKTYPGVRALDNVSIDIHPVSIHALVGENGAGKSTLVKILAGAVMPDSGSIALDGHPAQINDTRAAQQKGISIVYQELNLIPQLSVAENIFLGRWPHRRFSGAIDFIPMHQKARRLLDTLGIALPTSTPVSGLSIAQQQMVEIARALSLEARVLVLDEPSAVLTSHELHGLFRLVREARDRGMSIIYISHRLEEIFELADRVSVMRDGRHVSTRPVPEVDRATLISEMVGRPLDQEFPVRQSRIGNPMLRCRSLKAGTLRDATFELRTGEVLGITGLVGSGRTSLGRALFGAIRSKSGEVELGSKRGPFRTPRRAIAAGLVMVPEDRKQQGLLSRRTVRENITLAYRKSGAIAGIIQPQKERELVWGIMSQYQIKAPGTETIMNTLSGGNQQKALLARWIFKPQKVLVLDEPTRGVDVGAKYEIYKLINSLAERGTAIILISSELPEVIGMCDRIGVMHEGRLVRVLDNPDRGISQERILRIASGEEAA